MSIFKVYRFKDEDRTLSELVLTTEARHAPHALLIAFELTCPDDNVEQRKLFARAAPEEGERI